MDWTYLNKYYRSPQWKIKREMALAAKGRWCRGCLKKHGIFQVHHKSYRNVPNEPLADLEVLCVDCHKEITIMQRQNRSVDGFTLFAMFVNMKRVKRLTNKGR